MVYFKLLLNDKRENSNAVYPIIVRVTFNRKNTSFSTGIRVHADQWDTSSLRVKSSHPNAQAYNKTVSEFNSRIQNLAYKLLDEGEFSFEELKARLRDGDTKPQAQKAATFKVFSDQLVEDMLSVNQTGNAIVYRTTINRFMAYTANPKLRFIDIDYKLLEGFKRHLLKDGMKQNTVSNYFRTLRAIYNKAIKAKLVNRSKYPFLDISVKTEKTAKRAITIDDLKAIANIHLPIKSPKWHARNYFLLSFGLIGASFTDLAYLTPANIKKGRLTYKRRKTGKELNIKLHPHTEQILLFYSGNDSKYLLPVLEPTVTEDSMRAKALIAQWIKTTNKWLGKIVEDCKLECDVTTYVARHSWATTAKRSGYSIEIIAEAMGHEHGNRITNIYLDTFDQSLIDEVNEKVIGLIN